MQNIMLNMVVCFVVYGCILDVVTARGKLEQLQQQLQTGLQMASVVEELKDFESTTNLKQHQHKLKKRVAVNKKIDKKKEGDACDGNTSFSTTDTETLCCDCNTPGSQKKAIKGTQPMDSRYCDNGGYDSSKKKCKPNSGSTSSGSGSSASSSPEPAVDTTDDAVVATDPTQPSGASDANDEDLTTHEIKDGCNVYSGKLKDTNQLPTDSNAEVGHTIKVKDNTAVILTYDAETGYFTTGDTLPTAKGDDFTITRTVADTTHEGYCADTKACSSIDLGAVCSDCIHLCRCTKDAYEGLRCKTPTADPVTNAGAEAAFVTKMATAPQSEREQLSTLASIGQDTGTFAARSPDVTNAEGQPDKGIDWLGIGYDAVKGNPRGDAFSKVDPGFRRPVIALEFGKVKARDLRSSVPQYGYSLPESTCKMESTTKVEKTAMDYASDLQVDVSASAAYKGAFSVAFKASAGYRNFKKEVENTDSESYILTALCLERHFGLFGSSLKAEESFALAAVKAPILMSDACKDPMFDDSNIECITLWTRGFYLKASEDNIAFASEQVAGQILMAATLKYAEAWEVYIKSETTRDEAEEAALKETHDAEEQAVTGETDQAVVSAVTDSTATDSTATDSTGAGSTTADSTVADSPVADSNGSRFRNSDRATSCTSFRNDKETNHFTADCSGVTATQKKCALTHAAGYSGGSVTCNTNTGEYQTTAALSPKEKMEDAKRRIGITGLNSPSLWWAWDKMSNTIMNLGVHLGKEERQREAQLDNTIVTGLKDVYLNCESFTAGTGEYPLELNILSLDDDAEKPQCFLNRQNPNQPYGPMMLFGAKGMEEYVIQSDKDSDKLSVYAIASTMTIADDIADGETDTSVEVSTKTEVFPFRVNSPPPFAKRQWQDTFLQFGTHYIEDLHTGGRLDVEVTFDSEAKTSNGITQSSVNVALAASFGGGSGSLEAGVENNNDEATQSAISQGEKKITFFGGSAPATAIDSEAAFQSWAESIRHRPMPIKYSFAPLYVATPLLHRSTYQLMLDMYTSGVMTTARAGFEQDELASAVREEAGDLIKVDVTVMGGQLDDEKALVPIMKAASTDGRGELRLTLSKCGKLKLTEGDHKQVLWENDAGSQNEQNEHGLEVLTDTCEDVDGLETFALMKVETNGNLVIRYGGKVVWESITCKSACANQHVAQNALKLQPYGELQIMGQGESGKRLWDSGSSNREPEGVDTTQTSQQDEEDLIPKASDAGPQGNNHCLIAQAKMQRDERCAELRNQEIIQRFFPNAYTAGHKCCFSSGFGYGGFSACSWYKAIASTGLDGYGYGNGCKCHNDDVFSGMRVFPSGVTYKNFNYYSEGSMCMACEKALPGWRGITLCGNEEIDDGTASVDLAYWKTDDPKILAFSDLPNLMHVHKRIKLVNYGN